MSETSLKRSQDFLSIASQFKLGALVTESSHPVTARLSEVARAGISQALKLLFTVDQDVLHCYREMLQSGRFTSISKVILDRVVNGGKIFFTGCGSTGRLSIQLASIWRDFWQQQKPRAPWAISPEELERRVFPVMAGGDYALIKAVEGFEDFAAFGAKQITDAGLSSRDVVFAITEGGETSFVIGTAWKGIEAGAKVYFVYNNPDAILCEHVQRSREVIEDSRVEKINLTTGPMAITGSTRMQATTIQLAIMLTLLEMVVRELLRQINPLAETAVAAAHNVPTEFLDALSRQFAELQSDHVISGVAALVSLEESVYRGQGRNNYFADAFSMDVLTDTTERSPTFCTPPFRKADDVTASESLAFLFVPSVESPQAWEHILKRRPVCLDWKDADVRPLIPGDRLSRTSETLRKITYSELMRFRVGQDGLSARPLGPGDSAIAIGGARDLNGLGKPAGFQRVQLEAAHRNGARTGLIFIGTPSVNRRMRESLSQWGHQPLKVFISVPETGFLLDGISRVGLKALLNALSTCTMVRLGRVMGNYMVWVVPSNLKLVDRATRYIQKLTGLQYAEANALLFEVLEYVEPRMKSDQAYPPVVGLAVLRHRYNLSNEEAEKRLMSDLAVAPMA